MLKFAWISSSLLNKDNDETFSSNGNYSGSIRFSSFTVPMNGPTSILSFN